MVKCVTEVTQRLDVDVDGIIVFPYHKELHLKDWIRSLRSEFSPLRAVPILKRDTIEENHW